MKVIITYIIPGILLFSCRSKDQLVLQEIPSSYSNVHFNNQLSEGIDHNILNYVYYYNGAGLGIADLDNDGLLDLVFAGNEVASEVYRNQGGLAFEKVNLPGGIRTSSWCTGVSIEDVNGDGWFDIYFCVAGAFDAEARKNLLYINEGNFKFSEQAEGYGIADTSFATQAVFFDYDQDGDKDLYIINHSNVRDGLNTPKQNKLEIVGDRDKFYRNDGNGHFTDVSNLVGIKYPGYGLGVSVADFNEDGWEDIYVSNDFLFDDILYINSYDDRLGQRVFVNQLSDYFLNTSYNGMGCEVGDINNDGHLDLIEVDMLPETISEQKRMAGNLTRNKWNIIQSAGYFPQFFRNTLQVAQATAEGFQFQEISRLSNVDKSDWSWGPILQDINLDGFNDLFISNGYLRDIADKDFINYTQNLTMFQSPETADSITLMEVRKQNGRKKKNKLYLNQGNLRFDDVSDSNYYGSPGFSNGVACADLDNDGDLDIVTNNINAPASIIKNNTRETKPMHFVQVKLPRATDPVTIKVFTGSMVQTKSNHVVRGFMSSSVSDPIFGINEYAGVDSLKVYLYRQLVASYYDIAADQIVEVHYTPNDDKQSDVPEDPYLILIDSSGREKSTKRIESFADIRLPSHIFEDNPDNSLINSFDLNADGWQDLIYIHVDKSKSFIRWSDPRISSNILKVIPGILVDLNPLDFNHDSLPDLFISSSLSEGSKEQYFNHIYIQDHPGSFKVYGGQLFDSTRAVRQSEVADINNDGLEDLILCYSKVDESSIIVYDFESKDHPTQTVFASELPISDFAIGDINGDGWKDIVVAQEFASLTVLVNRQNQFVQSKTNLGNYSGLWSCVELGDFDQDGNLDIIGGNSGINISTKPSLSNPIKIYTGDINLSGQILSITTISKKGVEVPLASREDLVPLFPGLTSRYPNHTMYSKAMVGDFIPSEHTVKIKLWNWPYSTIFYNQQGGEAFEVLPLPNEAQIAPINSVLVKDMNRDNAPDLIIVGNRAARDFKSAPHNASLGLILLNKKDRKWENLTSRQSGILLEGITKQIITTHQENKETIVFLGSDNELKEYIIRY